MEVKSSVNTDIRKCNRIIICNVIEESKSQLKSLWQHVNNIASRQSNSNVSSLTDNGKNYTFSYDIAETLNSHFSAIGTKLTSKHKLVLIFPIFVILHTLLTPCKRKQDLIFAKSMKASLKLKYVNKLKTNKSIGLGGASVSGLLKKTQPILSQIV